MKRRVTLLLAVAGLLLTAQPAPSLAAPTPDSTTTTAAGFVVRKGDQLYLDGKRFRFAGTNNYYLMYKSRTMVDDVVADARAAGFTVLRHWGFLDIGTPGGTDSVAGPADGVYFQYWDGEKPAYHDGPDGLERLDYVLFAARQAGIKLVIPLTNNWRDFGGMDQYVRWRGGQYHDEFYTDPVIRGWYRDWISHVLNRTNTLTGVKYKDDPTVMTWELGNEPRCKGSGVYPTSPDCTTETLTAWADEMTRHIKSIDRRHLASVGDEGFYCDDPASADWTTNCGEGVDSLALTRLPAVDVVSYHLYPDHWGKDATWGAEWIKRHNRDARRLGKPVLLGEFGWHDKATRNPVFQRWTDAFTGTGGSGFLYWILSGVQDDGSPYPDYDGFTVYCPSPVCTTISNAGEEIRHGQRSRPPVADHDSAVTETGTPVTLTPAGNDIAYRTQVRPASIDLDPSIAGQQVNAVVTGGGFTLDPVTGTVAFTPDEGFQGRATAAYTIRDQAGCTSNVAELVVTVKPAAGDPILLASWETGVEGWAPGDWQADAGTLSQTTEYATQGAAGLRVAATGGGWFGVTLPEPVDLSAKATLRYDLRAGAGGTSSAIAVQTGAGWAWCQSTFGWVPENTETTVVVDLLSEMSCDGAALADVRVIWLWGSPGTHDVDHLRAE
ncbi:cellulase family glycosylhydrolase [Plantactinospora sp. B24E8]|uniref:cellulase family glycosylhydrolase n=1 Tax=Plantactinospora sp. B24E8 TaxID=3153567 RepID=UPI00325EB0A6